MKKRALQKRICGFLFGFLLCVWGLLFSVGSVAFDHRFYMDFYRQEQLADQLGMTPSDLETGIFAMTDYVEGKRSDMSVYVEKHGEITQAFNEKEKAHMIDVRALWQHALMTGRICLIVSVLLAVFCVWRFGGKEAVFVLGRGFFQGFACFMVVLLFFGFWALADFSGFWVQFHHLFFTNDLWLLDPATDFMIQICPENLFSAMVLRIVVKTLVFYALCSLASWIGIRWSIYGKKGLSLKKVSLSARDLSEFPAGKQKETGSGKEMEHQDGK